MKRLLIFLLVLVGTSFAWKHWRASAPPDLSLEQIRQLATTVKPGEIVLYSANGCGYCDQAKGWLAEYGFPFSECNVSTQRHCERELISLGGTGTPYLVVRGRAMEAGFDSDEFLAILREKG